MKVFKASWNTVSNNMYRKYKFSNAMRFLAK